MFKLCEKYEIIRNFLKCDYIRYSPSEISTTNTPQSQIQINLPIEDSVIPLLYSYLESNFDVLHAATGNRFVDNNDIRLVNLGPFGLFGKYMLTASSGKHLENIEHGHVASLMYKLLTSIRNNDELSIGFDRSRERRKRELTNVKKIKGKYHVIIYLKDAFGFAEHRENCTNGLGYILTINNK